MTRQFVGDLLKKQVLYQLARPSTGRGKAGTQSLVAKEPYNVVAIDLTEFRGFILNIVLNVFSRKAWIDQVDSKKPADIKSHSRRYSGKWRKRQSSYKLTMEENSIIPRREPFSKTKELTEYSPFQGVHKVIA